MPAPPTAHHLHQVCLVNECEVWKVNQGVARILENKQDEVGLTKSNVKNTEDYRLVVQDTGTGFLSTVPASADSLHFRFHAGLL